MTQDELRRALTAYHTGDYSDPPAADVLRTIVGAAERWLAANPADDDAELIDAAFLTGLGFACELGLFSRRHEPGTDEPWSLCLSYAGWGAFINCDGTTVQLPLPETRGDIRRLLTALGITR